MTLPRSKSWPPPLLTSSLSKKTIFKPRKKPADPGNFLNPPLKLGLGELNESPSVNKEKTTKINDEALLKIFNSNDPDSRKKLKELVAILSEILKKNNFDDAEKLASNLNGALSSKDLSDCFERMSDLAVIVCDFFFKKADLSVKIRAVHEWFTQNSKKEIKLNLNKSASLIGLSVDFYQELKKNFSPSITKSVSDSVFLALLLVIFFDRNTTKGQESLRFIVCLFLDNEKNSNILDRNTLKELDDLKKLNISPQSRSISLSPPTVEYVFHSSTGIEKPSLNNNSLYRSLFFTLRFLYLNFFDQIFKQHDLENCIQTKIDGYQENPAFETIYYKFLDEYCQLHQVKINPEIDFLKFPLNKDIPQFFLDFCEDKAITFFLQKDTENFKFQHDVMKLLLLRLIQIRYFKSVTKEISVNFKFTELLGLRKFLTKNGKQLGQLAVDTDSSIRVGIQFPSGLGVLASVSILFMLGRLTYEFYGFDTNTDFGNLCPKDLKHNYIGSDQNAFLRILDFIFLPISFFSVGVYLLVIAINEYLKQKVVFNSSLLSIYNSGTRDRKIIRELLLFGYGLKLCTQENSGISCLRVDGSFENDNLKGGTKRPPDAIALKNDALNDGLFYLNRGTFHLGGSSRSDLLDGLMRASKLVGKQGELIQSALARLIFREVAVQMRSLIEYPTDDARMKLFWQLQTVCILLPSYLHCLLSTIDQNKNSMSDRIVEEITNFFNNKSEAERKETWDLTDKEACNFNLARSKVFKMFSTVSEGLTDDDFLKIPFHEKIDIGILYQISNSNGKILDIQELFFKGCDSEQKNTILEIINTINVEEIPRNDSLYNFFSISNEKSSNSKEFAKLSLYINFILKINKTIVDQAQTFVNQLESNYLINKEIKDTFNRSPKSYIKQLIKNCILFFIWYKKSSGKLSFENFFLTDDKTPIPPKIKVYLDEILGFYGTNIKFVESCYDRYSELLSKILSILWGAGLQFANPAGAMNQLNSLYSDEEFKGKLDQKFKLIENFFIKNKRLNSKQPSFCTSFTYGSVDELLNLRRISFPIFFKWLCSSSIAQRYLASKQVTALPRSDGGKVEIFGATLGGDRDPWPFGIGPRACPAFGKIFTTLIGKFIDDFLNQKYIIEYNSRDKHIKIVIDARKILMNPDTLDFSHFVEFYVGKIRYGVKDGSYDYDHILNFDLKKFGNYFAKNYQSHIVRLQKGKIEYKVTVRPQVYYLGSSLAKFISVCKISNLTGVETDLEDAFPSIFLDKTKSNSEYSELIRRNLDCAGDIGMFDLAKCLESIGLDKSVSVVESTYENAKLFCSYLKNTNNGLLKHGITETVLYGCNDSGDFFPVNLDIKKLFDDHLTSLDDLFSSLNSKLELS